MAEESLKTEKAYLESFLSYLREEAGIPVIMLAGKKVDWHALFSSSDISSSNIFSANSISIYRIFPSNIAKSYSTACILRSCQGFKNSKNIYYYDEEIQVSNNGAILLQDTLHIHVQTLPYALCCRAEALSERNVQIMVQYYAKKKLIPFCLLWNRTNR